MVPAIAFRHPDKVCIIFEPMEISFGTVIDKGFGDFFDEGGCCTGFCIDCDNSKNLMASLIVKEGEAGGVCFPAEVVDAPGVIKKRLVEWDFLHGFDAKQVGKMLIELVAWLIVVEGNKSGLELIFGGGFDEVDDSAITLGGFKSDEGGGIRCPMNSTFVAIFSRAIGSEFDFIFGRVKAFDKDVGIAKDDLPITIGGSVWWSVGFAFRGFLWLRCGSIFGDTNDSFLGLGFISGVKFAHGILNKPDVMFECVL